MKRATVTRVCAAAALALALSACGEATTTSAPVTPGAGAAGQPAGPPVPAGELPALSPDSIVPSVEVLDVASGERLDLASVVPSDRPVLLWAWAPHCPTCRREAPGVEEFAAANLDRLTVVGIGTQDDVAYAEDFLADTGVRTPRMLWDESFESWRVLGITAQPTWVLVRGDGSFVQGWIGALPREEVLEAIAQA